VDTVEVRWNSGFVEHVNLPSVDRYFVIEEGKGIVPSVYDDIAKSAAATAAKLHAPGN
jgi:hypothetical protein